MASLNLQIEKPIPLEDDRMMLRYAQQEGKMIKTLDLIPFRAELCRKVNGAFLDNPD